ncbi:C-X-C chemokine receptor type 3-like [Brachyhypopomus gauderio]|uniref:C-X-C chemokine receptor type 3-like n=1 Tax=Brachyhypopomus gauderio TaxID=698409 RepID=UPI0040427F5F
MDNASNMELDLRGLFEQNGTFDYLDYEYEEDCHISNLSRFWAIFIPILYSLAVVVGFLGNGLVLGVLWQKRRSWSVTDTFILHLTVADTLLLLTMPLWAVEAVEGWTFGTPLCKITGALFTINFYCGIFLLACISLDRYLSVVHTVQMYSRRKPWLIQLSCVSVWFFSLLLSIPEWMYLQVSKDGRRGERTDCVQWYPEEWRLPSRLLYHVVGFLLPAVVLLYCYCCILVRLQRGSPKQRSIWVILALVLAFFISWTPYNIALLVNTVQLNHRGLAELSGTCEQNSWTSVKLTAVLGFLHCTINPVIYISLSGKFRSWVFTILKSHSCVLDTGDISLWYTEDVDNKGPSEDTSSLQTMNHVKKCTENQTVVTEVL